MKSLRRYSKSYQKIKVAKANHREALKNAEKYENNRNRFLIAALSHKSPRFNVKLEIVTVEKLRKSA